jgi:hypothetical protein
MRNLKIFLLLLVFGGMLFYNSNWFQSAFLSDRFYKDICYAPFDVTVKGESISIPLKYKFKTCYKLSIAVPDKKVFHDRIIGPGTLKYQFISKGRVLAKGRTYNPDRHHFTLYRGITSMNILAFNLPFFEADDDLTLELEVVEPMEFLEPYTGNIFCRINSDYDAKLGKCYNDDLLIVR